MKDQTCSVVRIKLNLSQPDSSDVKNFWMSLNYDQKPTIAHIADHIKKQFLQQSDDALLAINANSIKLFLDDYWLPPSENSRLLRENDCIK